MAVVATLSKGYDLEVPCLLAVGPDVGMDAVRAARQSLSVIALVCYAVTVTQRGCSFHDPFHGIYVRPGRHGHGT